MGIPFPLYCLINLLISSWVFMFVVSTVDPFSEALLSLKSEITDNSGSLRDWILPPIENPSGLIYACSWSGVKCNKNSSVVLGLDLSNKNLGGVISDKQFNIFSEVIDLNLSHNTFSGKLPYGIFNLTNLRSLDISRNNFSGQFPSGISRLQHLVILDVFSNSFSGLLPAEVSQLEVLKVLNFAGSYFNGPIPSEYGLFKNLEFIHLAGNFLGGQIPSELGMLKTVTHMEIGYNTYQGSIPWQLSNMTDLQYLDIANANISGFIPKQLSNLSNLQSLFLFRNQLEGMIPWELSKITPLKSLDLSDNLLSGPIPGSFSELKNLVLLSLMYNDLSGTVPQGIAQLPKLETLLIWNNFLSGSLPESLGRYSRLKFLDVSTNNFIGYIPPDICAGRKLVKLILFSNNFTGGLSSSLSNCSSLARLRLEDNSFSGEISLKFSNLPDITYLDLSSNRFTSGIPTDIYRASKLEYVNISNNPELGGSIPTNTWSLPLLQNFSASYCNISSIIPPFQYCKLVFSIELSKNNLQGNVPESVYKCHRLDKLDLADNNLTGYIPLELVGLPVISILDLSNNNFNGPLPMEFGTSSSLKLLNVSFNNISGSIPSEKAFRMMDKSAFIGNPNLCGAPLEPCHHKNGIASGLELGSRRTQKLAWVLILCAVVVLLITLSVLGIFYLRRGSQGQWKMVSFDGLPQFTATDVLRSFNSIDAKNTMPAISSWVCKVVLPTGIMVSVKKTDWEAKKMSIMSEVILQMGNARHKNLIRVLGFCYNNQLVYLLYDYLPNGNLAEKIRIKRDWAAKYKIVIGIAKGLCFLHHDCYPPIPHGDLKADNIVFDENMEPLMTEFGFKYLVQLNDHSHPKTISKMKKAKEGDCSMFAESWTDEFDTLKEELSLDVYNFGEVVIEILTNGRLANAGETIRNKPKEVLLREICRENEIGYSNPAQEEINLTIDVVLLCTRSRPSDRPSMEDALKLLSGLKPR